MIRSSVRLACAAALAALTLPVVQIAAQEQAPTAPTPAQSATPPAEPAPAAAPVFPAPDPANFTAATPTKEVVNAFLHANWGFDDNNIWQVQAILKTPVEGVSKIVIFVGQKDGKQKPSVVQFFALPGGKFVVAGNDVIPFGEHPFADSRAMVKEGVDGPYRGSASKDLEIVEFADFQCPHCKAAQANMDKLAVDFPKARIVFQTFPLTRIHPSAAISAAYGICVTKLGGSNAFFNFVAAVFDGQDGLSTPDGATLTLNSAATKAGLEPAKVAACAETSAVKAQVEAQIKLAENLNVTETPTLLINGRHVPANAPYETIKQIIQFQAKLDGVLQ